MKKAFKAIYYIIIYMILLLSTTSFLFANEFWVSKSGNDNNGCSNKNSDACLTIQKAISLTRPGDTVSITSGTYIEDSYNSPYTPKCYWLDNDPASICINTSGTVSNPIVIQAAPGNEGKVIIDSELKRIGIQMHNTNYIHIKGLALINNYIIGIASWGQVENAVADESRLSIGCVIENNRFYNTAGPWGKNISAIGMWGTKNWIVRNNIIDKVLTINDPRPASGIQAYGVINALIENNTISNVAYGVFWKDHYVKDNISRGTWFESEIRYNRIHANSIGINIGIRGSLSPEAGENYIHHNIIYGYGNNGAGIYSGLAGAYGISGAIRIEHNILDGGNNRTASVSLDANAQAYLKGNIFTRSDIDIELKRFSETKVVKIMSSDYNIFDDSFKIIADRYSKVVSARYYSDLPKWQAAQKTDLLTLGVSNPDQHSTKKLYTSLFVDVDKGDYSYLPGSAAIGFMKDGSNAGPYQYGNEVIGSTLGVLMPVAPSKLKVD